MIATAALISENLTSVEISYDRPKLVKAKLKFDRVSCTHNQNSLVTEQGKHCRAPAQTNGSIRHKDKLTPRTSERQWSARPAATKCALS
ncbi:hypothetical protein PF002_g17236 [Phytophthora fragariae]|nr:hypothetical protein PF006_g14710 [Phytophthora fragariae]KAE9215911.1 hypothetical protein PF002_g17236 [Phytophthora fragariae]KAE9331457.1 hypothetical protein PF008_g15421 [Phytophthora fragariae]